MEGIYFRFGRFEKWGVGVGAGNKIEGLGISVRLGVEGVYCGLADLRSRELELEVKSRVRGWHRVRRGKSVFGGFRTGRFELG